MTSLKDFKVQPSNLTATTDVFGNEIKVGDRVRSFGGICPLENGEILGMEIHPVLAKGDRMNYVEGVVLAIGEVFHEGCARYTIKIEREVYWHHTTGYDDTCFGAGHEIHPPLNGTRTTGNVGYTFGVVKIVPPSEKELILAFKEAEEAAHWAQKAIGDHFRPLVLAAIEAKDEKAAWNAFDRMPSCVEKALLSDAMRQAGFKRG